MRTMIWMLAMWMGITGTLLGLQTISDSPPSQTITILNPDPTCEAPCWGGIQPRQLDYKATRNQLAAIDGLTPLGLDTWSRDGHTIRLEQLAIVIEPKDIQLGDLMLLWGQPDFMIVRLQISARQVQSELYVELHYLTDGMIIQLQVSESNARLSPNTTVDAVYYDRQLNARPLQAQDWHGFTWVWAW